MTTLILFLVIGLTLGPGLFTSSLISASSESESYNLSGPGMRTFTEEEIAQSTQEVHQNLSATLLREALESGIYETDPALFDKIAKGAAGAFGVLPYGNESQVNLTQP